MISADGVFFKDVFLSCFGRKITLFGRKTAAKSLFLDCLSCILHNFISNILWNMTIFHSFLYMYVKTTAIRETSGSFEGQVTHTNNEDKKQHRVIPSATYLRKGVDRCRRFIARESNSPEYMTTKSSAAVYRHSIQRSVTLDLRAG